MNSQKQARATALLSVIYFAFFGGLLVYATFYDLEVSKSLFNPQNRFGIFFEYFAEIPRYALRGPAFTVLLFTRHSLNGCLAILHRLLPFIRPLPEKALRTKAYLWLNRILNWVEMIGFGALAFFGWKMETDSAVKYVLVLVTGQEEGIVRNSALYIVLSIFFALLLTALGFWIASKASRETLNRLEPLALLGLFVYLLYPLLNDIKAYISRVRFREMVAYSNGFVTADGLSAGTLPDITRDMVASSDFSAFTRWYQKGNSMGVYSHADSFPSGHTGSAVYLFLSYDLCLAFPKLKKYAIPCFCLSTAYVTAMAVARVIRGAHYLSDVAMAALLCMAFLLIGRLVMDFLVKKNVFPTRLKNRE